MSPSFSTRWISSRAIAAFSSGVVIVHVLSGAGGPLDGAPPRLHPAGCPGKAERSMDRLTRHVEAAAWSQEGMISWLPRDQHPRRAGPEPRTSLHPS